METNIKLLGWFYIVMGVLGLLIGCGVTAMMVMGGAISGDGEALAITSIVGIFFLGIMVVLSVPGMITGWGLIKFQSWARIAAIILGVLNLPSVPFGTALGIFSFVVLLNDEAEALFTSR